MTERIEVEVVYALADCQHLAALTVDAGCSAMQAVRESGLLTRFPDLEAAPLKLGVFGKVVKAEHALRAGDRVEIYRALLADPKAVRRQRAEAGKKMKKGGGAA